MSFFGNFFGQHFGNFWGAVGAEAAHRHGGHGHARRPEADDDREMIAKVDRALFTRHQRERREEEELLALLILMDED